MSFLGKCSKFCDSVDDCNGFNIKDGICQLCSNTDTVENYNAIEEYFLVLLYLTYSVIAIYGYFSWIKKMKTKQ